jgi:hypothetical protein
MGLLLRLNLNACEITHSSHQATDLLKGTSALNSMHNDEQLSSPE